MDPLTTLKRTIIETFGPADPYVHETHSHQAGTLAPMEARLVGLPVFLTLERSDWYWAIEVGPYLFDHDDIEMLRDAIDAYDQARQSRAGEG